MKILGTLLLKEEDVIQLINDIIALITMIKKKLTHFKNKCLKSLREDFM